MRQARVAAYASRRAEHGIKPSIGVKPSRPSDSNRTAIGGKTNEALMHELLIDPDWRLAKSRTHPADSTGKPAPISESENSVEARVREQMERAFWAQAVESMSGYSSTRTGGWPSRGLIPRIRPENPRRFPMRKTRSKRVSASRWSARSGRRLSSPCRRYATATARWT